MRAVFADAQDMKEATAQAREEFNKQIETEYTRARKYFENQGFI